jgi:hemerythrin-like domain-containing protein
MTTERPSATSVLLGEHAAIQTVLAYLDRASDAVAQGRHVDPAIFSDMLRFFTLFVGQCHHGKEEQILFPLLRHRATDTDAVIAQLEQEHAQGLELVGSFAAALDAYAAHGMGAAGPLVAAARAYASYLRRHMEYEDEHLLARVEQAGPQHELAAALGAFDRFEEEVMGAGTHEELHRMIDTLGPRVAAFAG